MAEILYFHKNTANKAKELIRHINTALNSKKKPGGGGTCF